VCGDGGTLAFGPTCGCSERRPRRHRAEPTPKRTAGARSGRARRSLHRGADLPIDRSLPPRSWERDAAQQLRMHQSGQPRSTTAARRVTGTRPPVRPSCFRRLGLGPDLRTSTCGGPVSSERGGFRPTSSSPPAVRANRTWRARQHRLQPDALRSLRRPATRLCSEEGSAGPGAGSGRGGALQPRTHRHSSAASISPATRSWCWRAGGSAAWWCAREGRPRFC